MQPSLWEPPPQELPRRRPRPPSPLTVPDVEDPFAPYAAFDGPKRRRLVGYLSPTQDSDSSSVAMMALDGGGGGCGDATSVVSSLDFLLDDAPLIAPPKPADTDADADTDAPMTPAVAPVADQTTTTTTTSSMGPPPMPEVARFLVHGNGFVKLLDTLGSAPVLLRFITLCGEPYLAIEAPMLSPRVCDRPPMLLSVPLAAFTDVGPVPCDAEIVVRNREMALDYLDKLTTHIAALHPPQSTSDTGPAALEPWQLAQMWDRIRELEYEPLCHFDRLQTVVYPRELRHVLTPSTPPPYTNKAPLCCSEIFYRAGAGWGWRDRRDLVSTKGRMGAPRMVLQELTQPPELVVAAQTLTERLSARDILAGTRFAWKLNHHAIPSLDRFLAWFNDRTPTLCAAIEHTAYLEVEPTAEGDIRITRYVLLPFASESSPDDTKKTEDDVAADAEEGEADAPTAFTAKRRSIYSMAPPPGAALVNCHTVIVDDWKERGAPVFAQRRHRRVFIPVGVIHKLMAIENMFDEVWLCWHQNTALFSLMLRGEAAADISTATTGAIAQIQLHDISLTDEVFVPTIHESLVRPTGLEVDGFDLHHV